MGLPYKDYSQIVNGDGKIIFVSSSDFILDADKEFESAMGYSPAKKGLVIVGHPLPKDRESGPS